MLNESFVNAWALAKDVKALAADEDLPAAMRTFAAALAERYSYPVDAQIVRADGTLLGQIAANDMFTDPSWDYGAFLRAALEKEK